MSALARSWRQLPSPFQPPRAARRRLQIEQLSAFTSGGNPADPRAFTRPFAEDRPPGELSRSERLE